MGHFHQPGRNNRNGNRKVSSARQRPRGGGGENTAATRNRNIKRQAPSPNGRIMISTWRRDGGGGGEKNTEIIQWKDVDVKELNVP